MKNQEHILDTWNHANNSNSESPKHMHHPLENISNVANVMEKKFQGDFLKGIEIIENSSRTCRAMPMTVPGT